MRVEVRRDDQGHDIDEVLLFDDQNQCIVHLERLSKDVVWFGVYPSGRVGEEDVHFDIWRDRKHIRVSER